MSMSSPKAPKPTLEAILERSARLKEEFDKLNEQMRAVSRQIFENQELAIEMARRAEKEREK